MVASSEACIRHQQSPPHLSLSSALLPAACLCLHGVCAACVVHLAQAATNNTVVPVFGQIIFWCLIIYFQVRGCNLGKTKNNYCRSHFQFYYFVPEIELITVIIFGVRAHDNPDPTYIRQTANTNQVDFLRSRQVWSRVSAPSSMHPFLLLLQILSHHYCCTSTAVSHVSRVRACAVCAVCHRPSIPWAPQQ